MLRVNNQWSTQQTASLSYGGRLQDVVVISSNDVWAVGHDGPTNLKDNALAEHWNGSSWTAYEVQVGSNSNQLQGVSAGSSTYIWAVGLYKGSVSQNLALRWSSSGWTNVYIPNSDTLQQNELFGVSVVPGTNECSGGDTWAVGTYNDTTRKAHALRYTLSPNPNVCP